MEIPNASHPLMIAAVETQASKATLGPQAGLCIVWSESAVEAEMHTEDSEVSHEPVRLDLVECPAQPWKTIVNSELICHLQRSPPMPCKTFPRSGTLLLVEGSTFLALS